MQLSIEIPDDLLARLVPPGQDAARTILEDSAAEAYREGRLTKENLGELLSLPAMTDVHAFLGARQIDDVTVAELQQQLDAAAFLPVRQKSAATA